jgi:hypothetical protein
VEDIRTLYAQRDPEMMDVMEKYKKLVAYEDGARNTTKLARFCA